MAMIALPLVAFIPEHFLGRKLVFANGRFGSVFTQPGSSSAAELRRLRRQVLPSTTGRHG
jgi:hypothetical protein